MQPQLLLQDSEGGWGSWHGCLICLDMLELAMKQLEEGSWGRGGAYLRRDLGEVPFTDNKSSAVVSKFVPGLLGSELPF